MDLKVYAELPTISFDGAVIVTLSERNLRDLLLQLQQEDNPTLVRVVTLPGGERITLRVNAEHDEVHYAEREAGPGYGNVT